jgi:hypothetical protein
MSHIHVVEQEEVCPHCFSLLFEEPEGIMRCRFCGPIYNVEDREKEYDKWNNPSYLRKKGLL